MRHRIFAIASAVSIPLCACLLLSPAFGNSVRFWVETPFGDVGPFDNSFYPCLGVLAIALAILPILWIVLRIRRELMNSTRPPGLCPSCSYDLTGNVSGICPECGTDVISEAGA